ncbi:hypothetical protein F511_11228 [Dorcoceras hygrometricum]|uniref:Uncharacterized protein n=1 Tax=Dorcoceras hygrometricum TaxID=472368 RepID=A0A2Z7DH48_9LAMI|nr:hypothetical protein F511_11228 [Dorcoceras hygrometricum]
MAARRRAKRGHFSRHRAPRVAHSRQATTQNSARTWREAAAHVAQQVARNSSKRRPEIVGHGQPYVAHPCDERRPALAQELRKAAGPLAGQHAAIMRDYRTAARAIACSHWRRRTRRIGYPRMSASDESSTTMHRLLHASGPHPIPPPNDPKFDDTSHSRISDIMTSPSYLAAMFPTDLMTSAVLKFVNGRYDDVSSAEICKRRKHKVDSNSIVYSIGKDRWPKQESFKLPEIKETRLVIAHIWKYIASLTNAIYHEVEQD